MRPRTLIELAGCGLDDDCALMTRVPIPPGSATIWLGMPVTVTRAPLIRRFVIVGIADVVSPRSVT